jgi:hypothetical protein
MFFALVSLVLAAGPTRCTATWSGPERGCALRGDVQATATAPTEKGAERAIQKEIARVVDVSSDAMMAQIPFLHQAEFSTCQDTISDAAIVSCTSEPQLAGSNYCFVVFQDDDCWSGDVLSIEDVGWRALENGRREMCSRVDQRLVEQNYNNVGMQRAVCRAKCEQETVVSCPSN